MASPQLLGVVLGIAGYLGFVGLVIGWAIRWSRRRMDGRTDGIGEARTAGGARKLGEERVSRYRARSVEYDVEGKRVWVEVYAVSRDYVRVNLRVPTATPLPHIRIHRERAFDRFGKAIGLNRE